MRVIAGSARFADAKLRRPVVTIGNFDGIHLGHQAILRDRRRARAGARRGRRSSTPSSRIRARCCARTRAPALLTTLEQKLELIAATGVDAVVLEPFTAEFARTAPDAFVRECLHARLAPLEVYVGYDFHFGRDREGSMRLLTELGPRLGFAVTIIPEVEVDEGDVNSTRIRQLPGRRASRSARRACSGAPTRCAGAVVRGDERGRTLGFPDREPRPRERGAAGGGRLRGHAAPARRRRSAGRDAASRRHQRRAPSDLRAARRCAPRRTRSTGAATSTGAASRSPSRSRLRAERRFESVDALRAQIAADVDEARRRLEAS